MKQQISKGVLLSFIAQGIAVLVNLIYTPLMIRILGQGEYGLYQLVQSVANYMNLMNFGFSGAYISFFAREKARGSEEGIAKLNGMFLRIFVLISLFCIAIGLFLVAHIQILGNRLTAADFVVARYLMVVLTLNIAFSFLNTIFTVFIAANERFVFKQSVNILINVLIPLLNLPLLLLGFGSRGVVTITLALTLLRLLLNMNYCRSRLKMRFAFGEFDKKLLSVLVGFTFFIFLSDIVDQLNTNVDKFLLGRMISKEAVAVYSVGFELSTYYTFCSWVIPEMFIPEANRVAIEEHDNRKLMELFTRIGRYNNMILLLVLTGFILVGKPFIKLWVGVGYESSYFVALVLILAFYIPSVQTLGVNIQNAKNMHRPRSVIYFAIACMNIVLSIFLIRRWGVVGTSLGTFIAMAVGAGVAMNLYYHYRIGLNVCYFWKRLLHWTLPAGALCLAMHILLRRINIQTWPQLLLCVVVYSAVYIALLYLLELTAGEKTVLKTKWSHLVHKHHP